MQWCCFVTTVEEGLWFVEIDRSRDPFPRQFPLAPINTCVWFVGFKKVGQVWLLTCSYHNYYNIYVVTWKLYGISVNCGEKVGDSRRWRGRLQYAGSGSTNFHSWVG